MHVLEHLIFQVKYHYTDLRIFVLMHNKLCIAVLDSYDQSIYISLCSLLRNGIGSVNK